ncbi:transcription initiation factor IIA [Sarcoptes scabiei]|nr:transcription initiation factor IIA [Sarcoptes scabiei]
MKRKDFVENSNNFIKQESINSADDSKNHLNENRKILRAYRRLKIVDQNLLNFVLDTNILLNKLNDLKRIIASERSIKIKLKNDIFTLQYFMIPWTVINELDKLKNFNENREKAMNVIRFINEQLKSVEKIHYKTLAKIICLDKNLEATNYDSQMNNTETCNDNLILNCCISLKEQQNQSDLLLSSASKSDKSFETKIILMTNDINLQNKAMIFGIESCSFEEFLSKQCGNESGRIEFLDDNLLSNHSNDSQNSIDEKVLDGIKTNSISSNKRFRSSNSKSAATTASNITIGANRTRNRNLKKKIYQSNSKLNLNNHLNHQKRSTSIMDIDLSLKYELEALLSKFIVEAFQRVYGDDLWKSILGKKYDPNNASLTHSLRILKANWIGVFSDFFGRDNSLKNVIYEMSMSIHNQTEENFTILINSIKNVLTRWTK